MSFHQFKVKNFVVLFYCAQSLQENSSFCFVLHVFVAIFRLFIFSQPNESQRNFCHSGTLESRVGKTVL